MKEKRTRPETTTANANNFFMPDRLCGNLRKLVQRGYRIVVFMPFGTKEDEVALEFVWYLNDADYNFVWIAVLVEQTEFDHRIVALDIAFHIHHPIVLEVFLDVFL